MFTYDSNFIAYINILLGVVGFMWLLLRTTHRWGEYPYEIRLLLVVTLSFIFALLETSAEQILYDESVSFNSIVIFATKAFLIYVLFRTRRTIYRTGSRTPDNGDATNPDRNVSPSHVVAPENRADQPDALPAETEIERTPES